MLSPNYDCWLPSKKSSLTPNNNARYSAPKTPKRPGELIAKAH